MPQGMGFVVRAGEAEDLASQGSHPWNPKSEIFPPPLPLLSRELVAGRGDEVTEEHAEKRSEEAERPGYQCGAKGSAGRHGAYLGRIPGGGQPSVVPRRRSGAILARPEKHCWLAGVLNAALGVPGPLQWLLSRSPRSFAPPSPNATATRIKMCPFSDTASVA